MVFTIQSSIIMFRVIESVFTCGRSCFTTKLSNTVDILGTELTFYFTQYWISCFHVMHVEMMFSYSNKSASLGKKGTERHTSSSIQAVLKHGCINYISHKK